MELRYKLTERDTLNALRLSAMPSWAMWVFGMLLFMLFFIGIFLIDQDFALFGWSWLAISAALALFVYWFPRRQAVRAMRKNPSMQEEIILLFNDSGTQATVAVGKSELQWRAYTKYRETADFFLLFTSLNRSTMIPKRAMSSEQIEELRQLLNAKIRAGAKL